MVFNVPLEGKLIESHYLELQTNAWSFLTKGPPLFHLNITSKAAVTSAIKIHNNINNNNVNLPSNRK